MLITKAAMLIPLYFFMSCLGNVACPFLTSSRKDARLPPPHADPHLALSLYLSLYSCVRLVSSNPSLSYRPPYKSQRPLSISGPGFRPTLLPCKPCASVHIYDQ